MENRETNNVGGMRPQMGDTSLILPVTFDYSGGRSESKKSAIVWSAILFVISLIVGIGIITNKEGNKLVNIFFGLLVIYLVTFLIRFAIMKEGKIRRDMIKLIDADYDTKCRELWGIYYIEDEYPYFCRFRNGKSGIFVRLNKDVILGKYSESEYEHYEAIGDAYNLAGAGSIQMCHIDYMDNVGTDERLEESFVRLADVHNTDLKDVLTDIFSYQQSQMMERVTTFDVYLFMWNGSDTYAWSSIQRILGCFLDANYVSYHVLNKEDLRLLFKLLFNVHDFSAVDAMMDAFAVSSSTGVVPISLMNGDGTLEILGKTQEQKKEEADLKAREQELKKQELKNRKNKKKKKSKKKGKDSFDEDEVIDLF